jgi:hypothetical protein
MKVAKNPINRNMYHTFTRAPRPAFVTLSGNKIRKIDMRKTIPP